MKLFNKILLRGNRNVTIQSEGNVNLVTLNLDNTKEFLPFFLNHIENIDDVKSLAYKTEDKNSNKTDWIDLVAKLETIKRINDNFEVVTLLENYNPVNLFGLRRQFYKEAYEKRMYDDEIYSLFREKQNLLLIGNALAGKTRSLIELLKRIKNESESKILYVPRVKNFPNQKIEIIKDNSISKIVFFDDIDRYYELDGVNYLIKTLIEQGCQVIATCKTGPEYKNFKINSSSQIKDIFNIVHIQKKKFSQEELILLAHKLEVNLSESEYDGNIGSLLLPITKMRERYDNLKNENNYVGHIAVNFLKALKGLNFASNFHRKGIFDIGKMKDLCLRLTLGKHAGFNYMSNTKIEDALLKAKRKIDAEKIEKFYKHSDEALKLLSSDIENLNFINLKNNLVEVEEVYLEKIVDYSSIQAYKNINYFYNKNEQTEKGYFVKSMHYNLAIEKCQEYNQARTLFKKMIKNGIRPNQETYLLLIQKAQNKEDVDYWKNKAEEEELLSVDIYLELLKKVDEDEEITLLLDEYCSVVPTLFDSGENSTTQIVEVILNKESELDTLDLVEHLIDSGLKLNDEVFNKCVSRVNSIQEGKELLMLSHLSGTSLSISFFEKLVKKADSFIEASSILDLIDEYNLEFSVILAANLIDKTNTYEEALNVFSLARNKGVRPNDDIINKLIRKAEGITNAINLLKIGEKHNISATPTTFYNVIKKSSSFEEGFTVYKLAKSKNVELKYNFFNRWIEKAATFLDVLKIINLIIENDYNFVSRNLRKAVQIADTYEEVMALNTLIGKNKINTTAAYFTAIAEKPVEISEIYTLIESVNNRKFKLSRSFYNKVVNKVKSFEDIKNLIDHANKNKVTLSASYFTKLSKKVHSFSELVELIKVAKKNRNKLSEAIFVKLSLLTKKLDDSLELITILTKEQPLGHNRHIFNNILWNLPAMSDCWNFIEKLKSTNIDTEYCAKLAQTLIDIPSNIVELKIVGVNELSVESKLIINMILLGYPSDHVFDEIEKEVLVNLIDSHPDLFYSENYNFKTLLM